MELVKKLEEKLSNEIAILNEAYEVIENFIEIPLGNSDVQNLYLLVEEQHSPGRKARAYFARLWDRVQSLEENYFEIKKQVVNLKKLQKELEEIEDEYEKELKEIEIAQQINRLKYVYKLFQDCYREIEVLTYGLKQLPKINREEFEKQEFEHFKQKMLQTLQIPPAVSTLFALGYNIEKDGKVVETKELEEKIKNLDEFMHNYAKELPYKFNIVQLQGLPGIGNNQKALEPTLDKTETITIQEPELKIEKENKIEKEVTI